MKMEMLHALIIWCNSFLWGPPMLVVLMGTHVYLTIRLKFVQRYLPLAIRLSFSKDSAGSGDVSHFGALATALAATIGTGNIVGVGTAVALGGPGAVFWVWLTGIFGFATKFAEAELAVKYRIKTADGTMLGGPMYALEKGLRQKWLAGIFCVCTALTGLGIGNMVQANSISKMAHSTFGISPIVTGIIIATIVGMVILGGVKWIARACEGIVPFMTIFYIIGCSIILYFNRSTLVPAIVLIVQSAFTPHAAGGGFAGATVMMAARYGIARGLFSNEAGLGSAPIVAAAARTANPVRQALVSATGTFWDTVVVCALTGLVLVSSIMLYPENFDAVEATLLSNRAFGEIPHLGSFVLTVALFAFVFSTILGWSYYGERAVEYLFGKKSIIPYRILWVLASFVGSVVLPQMVWDLADMMNMLMAIPNLVALLLLSGVVAREMRRYLVEGNISDVVPE